MLVMKSAFAALLLLQVFGHWHQVYSYENDDLVFDSEGKLAVEVPLIEKHEEGFIHRIRRGIADWFSPWGSPTTTTTTTTPAPATTTAGPKVGFLQSSTTASNLRPVRNSGEVTDDHDNNDGGSDDKDEDNDIGDVGEGHRQGFNDNDDEDWAGSGDADGSGTSEPDVPTVPQSSGREAKFYRVTLTVMEPYIEKFADTQSPEYNELSTNLNQALVELLTRQIPNFDHFANVVKISPIEDPFDSEITLNIGSTYTDESTIREVLKNQLRYHSLGNVSVSPEGFTFRNFQEECNENSELRCRDGSCVPLNSRCDGTAQCPDQSDELHCPTTVRPTEQTSTEQEFFTENPFPGVRGNTNLAESVPRVPPREGCRGDDSVRCTDGSRSICSVQICDDVPDCDDAGDEKNCEQPIHNCGNREFACDVSRCILDRQRCDFIDDCEDQSDERDCNYPACTSNEFRCRNNQCIDSRQRCNGANDCHDKSDELNCPCKQDQFECTPGYCISNEKRCDGLNHCSNGRDEQNCQNNTGCRPDQFDCGGGHCINGSAKCNGRPDCPNYADEQNCTETTCSSDQFRCSDGACVGIEKRCNGHPDCRNGEDELQCGCGATEFRCNDGQCIDYNLQCNNYNDCQDGSDERDCGVAPCPEMDFTCGDRSCISTKAVCDGYDDCPNAEDELKCDRGCTPTQFKCVRDGRCIEDSYRCDGHPDCEDRSDEDCPTSSRNNTTSQISGSHTRRPGSVTERPRECDRNTEMRCGDGKCISLRFRCDNIPDCADNSDERDCGRCAIDEWRCAGGECLPESVRCDGRPDCRDGSDEEACVQECPSGKFTCNDGLCIDERLRCDGRPNCRDGSDEINCQSPYCPSGQLPCANRVCISERFFCDQNVDCLDGSDEVNCPGVTPYPPTTQCRNDEYTCQDRSCIPASSVCDGRQDCSGNEDELDCKRGVDDEHKSTMGLRNPVSMTKPMDNAYPIGTIKSGGATTNQTASRNCSSSDFVCADGSCIPAAHRCDNFYDCRDFTDEQYCFGCGRGQFRCNNGDCISGDQKCNRFIDCDDGSDEDDCYAETTIASVGRHCPFGQFPCSSDRICVLDSARCNGIPECVDGSDENGCSKRPQAGLNLKTYPSFQIIKENPIKEGGEVVFQCRDEGDLRARVRWLRGNNLPLPPGSIDKGDGRLEIPNIQLEHSGPYICEAVGYPTSTQGQRVTVDLKVEHYEVPSTRPPQICKFDEATCSNGDCIPKSFVCNGKFDCTDGSDEMRCSPLGCEPNQFRCANKQCVSKIWRCDGDKDCADGTDEENCGTPPPGSNCRYDEFQCQKYDQCIPKSFHCDMERDCQDGSDEFGCSPVYITRPPPPMVILNVGETMILTCSAIGVPVPEINWRLNWGHVPSKCISASSNGTGSLTCPEISTSDQGAYSCEALNIAGFVFAIPDAILIVKDSPSVCGRGQFNSEAKRPEECISCFCFGVTDQCNSAKLFTHQLLPPFDRHKVVAVDLSSGEPNVREEIGSKAAEIRPMGRFGVEVSMTHPYTDNFALSSGYSTDIPYFALPEAYHGSQLNSYGGFLQYTVRCSGDGRNNSAPSVIISGNGYTLFHKGQNIQPNQEVEESVRFFYGEWYKSERGREVPATRQDIMMVLANVDNILIKAKYDDSPQLDVTITDIVMQSANEANVGLGSASFVEECSCPSGYTGLSCQHCASGHARRTNGPWLGECYRSESSRTCQPGYYGDPSRNIPCEPCPCPHTNPSNQFGRTCKMKPNREPICDCPPGYMGDRCETCAPGYRGNPMISGDMCVPEPQCDPHGSLTPFPDQDGKCRCKNYATGLTCDQCKPNTFNRASKNQFGCISCFCMGITNRCTSSNWYRSEVHVSFTNSVRDFSLVQSQNREAPAIASGIHIDTINREIIYKDFPNRGGNDVYYWQLPSIFLGNQITSYGGNLKYTVRYVPAPGGQSSRNSAADVELISSNDINLLYYSRKSPEPNSSQSFEVPLLEQFWQRTDGTQADREHLLMALADIQAIRIKATYTTNTDETAISQVSLDTSEKYNTGKERAAEVEECSCPAGYTGLSCEDCAVGYTRAFEGLYLGICEPCNCNGHSSQCDSETGICENCADHTTGDNCEICETEYIGDATRGTPRDCIAQTNRTRPCNVAGTQADSYIVGRCECKLNVEGPECSRCRPATFGLSAENPNGCNQCYCSGVTDQCHESSLYIQQIPMWIYDTRHGFTLTDASRLDVIDDVFDINVAKNEIGYRFTAATHNRRLFWSLPAIFTGNKIKSYGGNLTLTQRFSAVPRSQPLKDQDVTLFGNGITLFWTNQQEIVADKPLTYSVPLRESEWRRLTTEGPRSASRTDLMTLLSNIETILVRASFSEGMINSFISDISLDTAVENLTGKSRATQIEACRCPLGYTGTSCENCARGYYRDINDRSVSILGSCNACPCNDHEESCEASRSGQVKCHCLSGYAGLYCQDIAELQVGLMPMRAQALKNSTVEFKCSYQHTSELYIYFKLTSYMGLPLTAWAMEPGSLVQTDLGAYRLWNVHVGYHPCNVECTVVDRYGKELAKISTTISPVDSPPPIPTPPPTITPPRIVASIQENKFQIVHTGSTVRYRCSGRSLDNNRIRIHWEKEGGRLPDRSLDDAQGLLVIRDVRVSDSGVYICHVTDDHEVVIDKVTLTVGGSIPAEPKAVIRPIYQQLREGEPVEFTCEGEGNPVPQLDWIRVEGKMNPQATFSNGVWRIPAVTINDAAEYKCIARNNIGVNEQTTILYVDEDPGKPGSDSKVERGPSISPKDWTGSSGETVRLICSRSDYHTNVFWTRPDNLPLPHAATQRDGILTITNPVQSDSGIYICIATSNQGTESSTTSKITINPRRNPPSIRVEPEKQLVSQGTIAEVKCLVNERDSSLEVKWIKYGESSLGPRAQQQGTTLKIINPQVSDRGVYICRASNPAGVFEASAMIEVEPRESPVLELYPKNMQTVILGGSADLQCRVIAGYPAPELHWSRQDNRPFASNIEELPGGLLRLTNITINDGGAYQCSATNQVGSTSAIARIEVQSIPVITITPSGGILRVKMHSRVRLTCSAEGQPMPNVAWSKYTNGYVSVKAQPSAPLTAIHEIMSMSPDDEGSYTCTASNVAGIAEERVQIQIEDDDDLNSVDEPEACRGDQPCQTPPPVRPDTIPHRPQTNDDGLDIPNDNLRIPIGGKVEMRCRVVGREIIYLDWIRSDRRNLPSGSSVHEGVLTINEATRDAAGEYICLGLDSSGSEVFRRKAYLEIFSPPRIILNPNTQTVAPGESPSIICTATGDEPMRIEWDAIGRALPSSVSDDRGVLRFHGITYTDAGKYVCRATNDVGTAEAVAEVLVNENSYDAGVRAPEKNVKTAAGNSVRLRCETREPAFIQWTKEGEPLPSNSRVGDNYLELLTVRPGDSGRYICQIRNAQGALSSDYIDFSVISPAGPVVRIEPSSNIVNIGDSFDLRCVFSSRNPSSPRYRWYKDGYSIPPSVQVYNDNLRIAYVHMSDSGVYVCRVDAEDGNFEQKYNLIVQGGENDEPAIEIKNVPYGSDANLECRVEMAGPVAYKWSKLSGILPEAIMNENNMRLVNVRGDAAGTYICTASNSQETTEVPTVLVVTGVVPNFSQAPRSFIALPPLPDVYLKFNIEVSFKPESFNGIILYNAERKDGSGDFVILSLVNGYPEFKYDLGSGCATIKSAKSISVGEWHTIKLQRNRKDGTMLVDGEGPYEATAVGRKQGLDLKELLYIGGVPDDITISNEAIRNDTNRTGFVGCISRFVVGEKIFDLMADRTDSVGVTTCETCAENPCHNSGVCQEATTKEGYTCLCRAGYSGKYCDNIGQSCHPGACGKGTCVDTETGFECHCPYGTQGSRCERTDDITVPAFRNERSFLAYQTPKAMRRIKLSMNFNPSDNGDGILMYCSQSDEGYGDFAALVIKDRHVEFRFDIGSGMAVVRSNLVIQPGVWTRVTLNRDFKDGKLSVNGEPVVEGLSPGNSRTMTLNTPLYIGGINRTKMTINRNIDVNRHFHGCINELEVSSLNLHLLKSTIDSSNIEDCEIPAIRWNSNSTIATMPVFRSETTTSLTSVFPTVVPYNPCSADPCAHGICQTSHNSYGYSCTCEYGYVGLNCENVLKHCELMSPCRNGGRCNNIHGSYKCDCPLGFNGKDCEKQVEIAHDVKFYGDGWLELDRSTMKHEEDSEVIGFEISTNKTDGLIMWHGQTPNDLNSDDYIALGVVNGYIEYQYNLGSGPAVIRVTTRRVDDGERHRIILKRQGNEGSIELNGEYTENGVSVGLQQILNARGNVYLGGVPDYAMTYGKYHIGFSGCIYTLEVQDSGAMDIGEKAIRGKNVYPCTRDQTYSSNDFPIRGDIGSGGYWR